ncbi:MAG: hypothetical protein AVDCRST_MAG68-2303, partial [uncultured Gemmatimonadetes bacterium]
VSFRPAGEVGQTRRHSRPAEERETCNQRRGGVSVSPCFRV